MPQSSEILSYFASVTARSLVLFAVAAAALLAFRVRTAAASHAVWTVVAAGMLLLAVLSPALPGIPLRVLKAVSSAPPPFADTAVPVPALAQPPVAAVPVTPFSFGWPEALLAAYAVVALALLSRLVFGYLFTRRLVRAAGPIPGHDDLYVSSWISVPLTIGRKILLPADWSSWDSRKLDAVLAHERSHVRRADWAVAIMAGVNRSIFWFHPLAWWLERKLASLAEEACDDSALLVVENQSYAQALLDMAAAVRASEGRLIWEAMAMAKAAEVRKRIDLILDESRQIPRGLTRLRWAALLLCSLPAVWLLSVAQLAPAVAQEPPRTGAAMAEFLKNRRQLSQADVATMEQYLVSNPHEVEARSHVILYYYANGIREPRVTHILWLIANHPEAPATAMLSQGLTPRDSAFNSVAEYLRVREAWKNAVAARSNEAQVLINSAQFLQSMGDVEQAEELLLNAARLQPFNSASKDRLGKLYAAAILGATGDPRFPNDKPEFANRVRAQLSTSEDGILLFTAGSALRSVARKPEPGSRLPDNVLNLDEHPLLAPAIAFGEELANRAARFGGPREAPRLFGVPGGVSAGAPGGVSAGVPGGVAGGIVGPPSGVPNVQLSPVPAVLNRVDPEYPALARQARISGVVRLTVGIATDGSVKSMQVVNGHPLLVPAALEAVREWRFQPPPNETTSMLEVPFTMPPGEAASGAQPGQTAFGRLVAPPPAVSNVQLSPAPAVLNRVDPEYPPLARQARISGIVRLRVGIATDGSVKSIEVVNGHPLLVPPALESVRQWRFQPPASEITSTVEVPFVLPPGDTPSSAQQGKQAAPQRIKVGGTVQAANLIRKTDPIYPSQAIAERIEGPVTLQITIDESGQVERTEAIEGNPILAGAAMEAVRQWVYRPTLLNGHPVTVITTVTVPFRLP
jgi:TonB family protein